MSRTKKAFTLPELVIAISITSVIALAVATVASALSNAYHMTDEKEESIQSGRMAMTNMETAIRKGKLVLAASGAEMALWTGDANGDLSINVDELVLIRSIAGDRTIVSESVTFPDSMPDTVVMALNQTITLASLTDLGNVRQSLTSATLANYFATRVLATDVESFAVATDVLPPLSRLVWIKMTVGEDPEEQISLNNSVHLRADAVDDVASYDGVWVLNITAPGTGGRVSNEPL